MTFLIVILLSFLFGPFVFSEGKDKVNVHLVAHTHDDVGWKKTIDEYYYGANKTIQDAAVQYILDTVMDELAKNKDRKFIYVEMAFFARWWNEQTDDMKNKVKEFLKNGQLEFINGGWCMNDEAATHYNAIIDQMTVGLTFIEKTFGKEARPTIAWHVDPFGHSAVQANLFSQMGFDGFFFGRIDYDDKQFRLNTSTMEMMWRGSQSLKEASDMFTGVLYNKYRAPDGFCYDARCTDGIPIQDDPNLFDYNVDERVDAFIKYANEQAKHYSTNNIMMTMGADFNYGNARMWFKNLDKLIHYVNKNGSVNVMYSTPSMYLEYVHRADSVYNTKTDDFFPYADQPWSFWTGYFTSRPGLKGYIRRCNNHLQACKQLEAIHNGFPDNKPSSMLLKKGMAVAQHHDAVTGTEKQHVANDYAKRLHIGEVECHDVISKTINDLAVRKNAKAMDLKFCEYLNISVCPPSESGNFNLVVYNPLAREWNWYLRFPVNKSKVSVLGTDGKMLPVQIFPVSNATMNVRRKMSTVIYEAVVNIASSPIPPLGYSVFTVRSRSSHGNMSYPKPMKNRMPVDDVTISNEYYQVEFDGVSGQIKTIKNVKTGIQTAVNQSFYWYNSSTGKNINSSQASGAYIFRPNSSNAFPVNSNGSNAKIVNVYQNDMVSEVHQYFASWLTQVVRLYKRIPAIEMEYTVGPIPVKDHHGKEIISRFDTDLSSDSVWYTDANGREMQKRKRNYRPSWKYNNTAPVAGNYYPVNSRIFIRDEYKKTQFTILNDRSQGGSSLVDGSVELMIHRRILKDDKRGVSEALNEPGQYGDGLIVRGKHYVIFDNYTSSTYIHRIVAEMMMLEPELAFDESTSSFDDLKSRYNLQYSALKKSLPDSIHLLTLEYLEKDKILLRLEHQFEASDPVKSDDVTVSLSDLFDPFEVKSVTELTLGANADINDIKKLSWKTVNGEQTGSTLQFKPVVAPYFDVKLSPMEIRTFSVGVETNIKMHNM